MSRIAILAGAFHKPQVERMINEVQKFCTEANHTIVGITWVPGSMEKPLALKRLLAQSDIDGVVVLGIIERGETAHGLVMANAVLPKIIQLELETNKPVGIGILGPEIYPSQIEPRVESYARKAIKALHDMLTI